MRKFLITALATVAAFAAVLITGCKDEPCKDITCAYSGACVDGLCNCQLGYEGIHCETVMREKFIGMWNVNEDGTLSAKAQYTASIEAGTRVNEVKIYNVSNVTPFKSNPVIATVRHDTLTIPYQVMPDNSKIEGWGVIKGTNPLDQHYYQHAVLTLYYYHTNPIGQVNKFGLPDEGSPSLWSK